MSIDVLPINNSCSGQLPKEYSYSDKQVGEWKLRLVCPNTASCTLKRKRGLESDYENPPAKRIKLNPATDQLQQPVTKAEKVETSGSLKRKRKSLDEQEGSPAKRIRLNPATDQLQKPVTKAEKVEISDSLKRKRKSLDEQEGSPAKRIKLSLINENSSLPGDKPCKKQMANRQEKIPGQLQKPATKGNARPEGGNSHSTRDLEQKAAAVSQPTFTQQAVSWLKWGVSFFTVTNVKTADSESNPAANGHYEPVVENHADKKPVSPDDQTRPLKTGADCNGSTVSGNQQVGEPRALSDRHWFLKQARMKESKEDTKPPLMPDPKRSWGIKNPFSPESRDKIRTLADIARESHLMGTIAIKLGQAIASSPHFTDAERELFRPLFDAVEPVDFNEIKETVTKEINKLNESNREKPVILESINPVPLGCGSLAQVHSAVLYINGRRKTCAIKVIKKQAEEDLNKGFDVVKQFYDSCKTEGGGSFFEKVIKQLLGPELQKYSPGLAKHIMADYINGIRDEIKLHQEYENTKKMKTLLEQSNISDVRVPYTFGATNRMLILEQIHGETLNQQYLDGRVEEADRNFARVWETYKTIKNQHGVFHDDLHPGNIIKEPNGKLVILDCAGLPRATCCMRDVELLVKELQTEINFRSTQADGRSVMQMTPEERCELLRKEYYRVYSPSTNPKYTYRKPPLPETDNKPSLSAAKEATMESLWLFSDDRSKKPVDLREDIDEVLDCVVSREQVGSEKEKKYAAYKALDLLTCTKGYSLPRSFFKYEQSRQHYRQFHEDVEALAETDLKYKQRTLQIEQEIKEKKAREKKEEVRNFPSPA